MLWLRIVVFLLITGVGVIASVRFGRQPHIPVPEPPHSLPTELELPFFRGRTNDLTKLLQRHKDGRSEAHLSTASDGPLLLAIHGRPGVGKTALAQRLALRLVGEYPDGQLYQNMGAEGRAREPREILLSLLGQLQWPEAEMLGKKEIRAAELAGTFRAKTAGKRMLIVLDAVRSRAQLLQVLPGTSTCTVIITSRANLHAGGQPSHRLGPVTPEEATEILLTACGDGSANKVDLVAEAIELCDFQPNALLSAGERARDEGLERTLERLRNEEDRLNALTYGGRNVGDRIASEYNNLEDLEKRAFLLLTVPESETFVPWALQPLIREIGSVQAGNLLAEISKGGLLELEGKDPSGFGRYRFSPLARLFAEQRLQAGDIPPAEVNEARERFRHAYLAGSLKVLHQAGIRGLPAVPFPVPSRWYPEVPEWEDLVASSIDFWAHAEFGNLIRAVLEAAHYDLWNACWQLAVRASDCFSPPARHADIQMAFEVALKAARRSSDPAAAEIQVRLARSGYLTAVHDYSDAITELTGIVDLAESAGDRAAKAEALRRLGHAWQELGFYDRAYSRLRDGDSIAQLARRRESRLIELLLAENEAFTNPDRWASQPPLHGARDRRDNSQFVEKIILCRSACRRRDPSACDDLLKQARQYCNGNLAHRLDIEYEEAATILHCSSNQKASPQAVPVLRSALLALRSSDLLGRPYAQARARCALAQALVQSGQAKDCLYQLSQAEQILQLLGDSEAQALAVYLERIRGEALLAVHQYREAVAALELADQRLVQRESWVRAEILVLLGIAHRELHDPVAALAAHATAVEIFRHHHDQPAAEHAFSELCTTLRAAGFGAYRTWRMRRAPLR